MTRSQLIAADGGVDTILRDPLLCLHRSALQDGRQGPEFSDLETIKCGSIVASSTPWAAILTPQRPKPAPTSIMDVAQRFALFYCFSKRMA